MKRIILPIVAMTMALLVASCGQVSDESSSGSKLTAGLYVPEPAIAEVDSAVNAFMQSPEGAWEFEKLAAIYKPYLEKYPGSTTLWRDYQDLHMRFQKQSEAAEYFKTEMDANPKSAMHAYLYGRMLTDEAEARKMFQKATELDPKYYWGWHGLGVSLLRSTPVDTTAAMAAFEKGAAADNTQPTPFEMMGNVYRERGDSAKALECFSLLAATDPADFFKTEPKIATLRQAGNIVEAKNVVKSFIDANPDNYSAVRELVDIHKSAGEYDQALPHIHRMTELASNPSGAYYDLIMTHCKMNQPDSSLAAIKLALDNGYDDFRPLLYDPELASVREIADFGAVKSDIESRMAAAESARQEMLKGDEQKRMDAALAEMSNDPAPQFTLVDLYGNTVNLVDLKGKPVVLDFWATWCGPCRMTMPLLQKFYEARKDDIHYFAVNVWEDDTTKVRPFLAKYGYQFNNLFGSNATASDYGVTGIPTLFVIDGDGIIRYRHIGYSPDADQQLGWQIDAITEKARSMEMTQN